MRRMGVIYGSALGFPHGPDWRPFGCDRHETLESYLPPSYRVRELDSGALVFEGEEREGEPSWAYCEPRIRQTGMAPKVLEKFVGDLPCAKCHAPVVTFLPDHYARMEPPVVCEGCSAWKHG